MIITKMDKYYRSLEEEGLATKIYCDEDENEKYTLINPDELPDDLFFEQDNVNGEVKTGFYRWEIDEKADKLLPYILLGKISFLNKFCVTMLLILPIIGIIIGVIFGIIGAIIPN